MPRKLGPRDGRAPARPAPVPPRAPTTRGAPAGGLTAGAGGLGRRGAGRIAALPAPSLAPAPAPVLRVVTPGEALPWELDPAAFPLLAQLGRNLTALRRARDGSTRWSGRAREIDEVLDVLGKRRTNNPCLVGEPGVGKTAVVEGVAQRLLSAPGRRSARRSSSSCPPRTSSPAPRCAARSPSGSTASRRRCGAPPAGWWSSSTRSTPWSAPDPPAKAPRTRPTSSRARWRAASSPASARPPTTSSGASSQPTPRWSGASPRWWCASRRWRRRWRSSPGSSPATRSTTGSATPGRAVEAAARLAARYVTDRFLPDKAVSLVDLAGSRCARAGRRTVEVRTWPRWWRASPASRWSGSYRGLGPTAAPGGGAGGPGGGPRRGGGPGGQGHPPQLRRLRQPPPMGSFLFLGPTGRGQDRDGPRSLAEVLFGSRDALVRLDMSELSESHATSRLVGAPAGYVGYQDGGQLTEAVRRRPSVGGAAGRGGQGPPRRPDGPPPGARGGPAHRRQGPPGRLLQHGGGAHLQPRRRGLRRGRGPRVGFGADSADADSDADGGGRPRRARRCPPSCGTASTTGSSFAPCSRTELRAHRPAAARREQPASGRGAGHRLRRRGRRGGRPARLRSWTRCSAPARCARRWSAGRGAARRAHPRREGGRRQPGARCGW